MEQETIDHRPPHVPPQATLRDTAHDTLRGTRVVVLGGTSGLGYAASAAAAREGASVIVASSRRDRVDTAVASLASLPGGGAVEGHQVDAGDEASVRALFARVGAFDHLVYTAGESILLRALAETDVAAARDYFGVRVWGAFAAVKHARPHLRAGGSVVLTSGTAGRRPQAGWALGAMICSAMEGLTRALAVELAPHRVNAVCPGVVRTPLWDGLGEDRREALYRDHGAALPVRAVGEPADVASAYLFLMRDRYVTGQALVVDGGGVLV